MLSLCLLLSQLSSPLFAANSPPRSLRTSFTDGPQVHEHFSGDQTGGHTELAGAARAGEPAGPGAADAADVRGPGVDVVLEQVRRDPRHSGRQVRILRIQLTSICNYSAEQNQLTPGCVNQLLEARGRIHATYVGNPLKSLCSRKSHSSFLTDNSSIWRPSPRWSLTTSWMKSRRPWPTFHL